MNSIDNNALSKIFDQLKSLEERIAGLESYLGIQQKSQEDTKGKGTLANDSLSKEEMSLEFKIGEFWLARMGAIILLCGTAFFISYPIPGVPALFVTLLGYLAVGGLYFLSRYWQKSNSPLSNILFGGSLVLMYFATIRLHFFSDDPIITNKALGLTFALAVLGCTLYASIKRASQPFSGIIILLCYITALLSDTAHFSLVLLTATSALTLVLLVKYNWQNLTVLGLMAVYFSHLLWLFNNPVLGNPLHVNELSHFNLIYLAIYGLLYGIVNIFRSKESYAELFEVILTLLNGFGIFLIGAINVLNYYSAQTSLLGFVTFIFFIIIAVLNWNHAKSSYSTSFYSCFAYVALSFAIFTQFDYPNYFMWLGLQSLLVIITALWFKSRIIIVANIFIYLTIFISYLTFSSSVAFVNLSYAITALFSARILNWKNERLFLKTDLIRNLYLTCAYIIVLYGLYHFVPVNLVSLCWLVAALFYFGLSILLKNIKYRYLAILTIFATVLHVFLIDMSRLGAGFRILLFMIVGAIILILSLVYTKYHKKQLDS
jgi:hypothetical protein